jgi:hypothetical protein
MGKVEDATAAVPVIQRDVATLTRDAEDLSTEFRAVRRALYTTALSIVGGAVLFAVSVLQIVH